MIYICKKCGKTFDKRQAYSGHQLAHKNYVNDIIVCDICGKECKGDQALKQHKTKAHTNYIQNENSSFYELRDDLFCQYCGDQCKNRNSLVNHERMCSQNPDQSYRKLFTSKGKSPWNKGLDITTSDTIRKASETYHKNKVLGLHKSMSRPHTEEEKRKLSEAAKRNGLGGFAWRRGIDYNGIKLDSSYEVDVAKSLDENGILWERPKRISYILDNEIHYYTPDFYLPEYNVYLDPKNDFLIENVNPRIGIKDVDKIHLVESQNNIRCIILDKNQLTWDEIHKLI